MKNKLFIYISIGFLNTLGYAVRSAFGNLDYLDNLIWFTLNSVIVSLIIYLPITLVVIAFQKIMNKSSYVKDLNYSNAKVSTIFAISFVLGTLLLSPLFPILSFLFATN